MRYYLCKGVVRVGTLGHKPRGKRGNMIPIIILAFLFIFLLVFVYFDHKLNHATIAHLVHVICSLRAFTLGIPAEELETLTGKPIPKIPPIDRRDWDEDFGEVKPPKDESET